MHHHIFFSRLKFYSWHNTNAHKGIGLHSVTLAFKYFQGDDQTNKIELQLEQLRLSSVEREFRKRIAEYNTGNGINGNGDSGSVSFLCFIDIRNAQININGLRFF